MPAVKRAVRRLVEDRGDRIYHRRFSSAIGTKDRKHQP
jgi:Arc/MetJ family transcription regulator